MISILKFHPPNRSWSMNLCPISVALLSLCFFLTFSSCSNGEADLTGDVSINCGSTGASTATNGRQWVGDVRPKLSPLLQLGGLSTASTTINKLISADPIPHKTARISRSKFSYIFQLNAGQKIIRLHFNPTSYRGFKGLRDFFTVEAGPFTLLGNFSASLTAHALGMNTFSKEFCLNIQENQQLTLTFSPTESGQSQDAYAFINGIEIISMPASLSYFDGGEIGLRVVGRNSMVYFDDSTALEIVHRLYIKQDVVQPTGDFEGVFPKWATKRAETDKVKNSTWKMPVEVGFRYLIRLHFSEIGLKIAGVGGSKFKILINETIVHSNTEIVNEKDHDNTILYRDYMVVMRGRKQNGRRDILISFQSFDELEDGVGVLAGFEILKLSNPDNSLACHSPLPPPQNLQSHTIRNLLSVLGYKHAIATVAVAVISVLSIILHKLREIWEAWSAEDEHKPLVKTERRCRLFSLAEIQSATRNFNSGLIGRGGFGKVYKGLIDNGQTFVAVKRLKWNSKQGTREFLTEIETLSELRHINLVSLIGYCSEHSEMILVYEYMARGTLADHLYKLGSDCSSLTWKQRLNICIGAARGLDYLHTGNGIIHRDVKASNILLDENFIAKVSDFGLAKTEDRRKLQSHVSTQVKGTRGYFDPYYIRTGKLTRKSDIYAFGVVLLEALCGRSALDVYLLEEEQLLSSWAVDMINKGNLDQIVASNLRQEISPGSLKTFVEVAERCLLDEPKYRPTMSQIVLQLESALEQHDSKEQTDKGSTVNNVYLADEDIISPENTEVQTLTSPADATGFTEIFNNGRLERYSPADEGDSSKQKTYSPFRLWTWGTFWNWIKPSKRSELTSLISGEEDPEVHLGQLKRFSLRELQVATDSFSNKNILRRDGFGKVYKGRLTDGTLVAVKRLKEERTRFGELQFQTEVEMISMAVHRNLLRLRGFCMTPTERLLVYPYMANGSVASYLRERPPNEPPLVWPTRKCIALGSARGLSYLHDHCDPKIIHRDVKAANILLDEEFEAVVGNFDVAKLMDYKDTHVTTAVRGTIGHIAPEYLSTGKISEKTDVFGYGIMLLELITGQRAFDLARLANDDDSMLLDWVKGLLKEKKVEMLVDPDMQKNYVEAEVEQLIQVALLCTQSSPMERPKMSEVVRMLEGDGLAEKWEVLRQEMDLAPHSTSDWIVDSIENLHAFELSGAR